MRCVRCNAENHNKANHCVKCGAPLHFQRRSDHFRVRKVLTIVAMFFLWVGGFGVVFRDSLFPRQVQKSQITATQRQELEAQRALKRKELSTRLQAAFSAAENSATKAEKQTNSQSPALESEVSRTDQEESLPFRIGWVSIVSPTGRPMARLRGAVMEDGWIALPTRALYGGGQWSFLQDDGNTAEIVSGVWSTPDAVSLWRLSQTEKFDDGMRLARWTVDESVSWVSIESQNEIADLRVPSGTKHGEYWVCATPAGIKEFGVFVQHGAIVGWSFGPWLNNVYLWNGQPGIELRALTDVADFYQKTFANGREEKFALALAMKSDHSELDRLTALADSFSVPPKLAINDTPDFLRSDEIAKALTQLVIKLIRDGRGAQVLATLNDNLLREIGNVTLLLDLIPAITSTQGIESAIRKLETLGKDLVEKGGVSVPAVNDQHLRLYQDWLQSLVTVKSLVEAAQVLDNAKAYYPNDPYLHLLGVEVSLLNGDWQEAERRLGMMEYPPSMQDRYELLARKIAELKGEEGTIVIRFTAGNNRIPVAAGLNQSIRQEFIIDTGASLVTIPSSTAEALNLQPVRGGHWDKHSVSTAGGVVSASEVLIESLEIGGWVEHNVSALVIDIPDQPGVGLLGMNYLSRFRMDLNTHEGKLTLRPK